MKRFIVAAALLSAASLAACGGGGGGGGLSTGGGNPIPATPAPGIAHFTISDPYGTQSAARGRNYFSTATAAILISANNTSNELYLSANSPECTVANSTISCAVDIPEPNGPLTFSIQTLDSNNVPLSQVSGSATINGKTAIPLALQGIWKIADARFSNETPLMGSPSVITVNVSAYDADNALIIGPEPYSSPVPLYNSDTSGASSLSKTSVTKPGDSATLTYNGTSYVNPVVSAGIPPAQAFGQQDTLVPALRISEYALPSGNFASNNAGLGRLIANGDNSISFMEQHALGRVTTTGQITETPLSAYYFDLVKGSDQNIWAIVNSCYPNCSGQDNNTLARINSDGSFTKLPMFPAYSTGPVVLGPDGNFWMPGDPGVPAAPVVQQVTAAGVSSDFSAASGMYGVSDGTAGSDGNMWFFDWNSMTANFLRVTPAGQISTFALPYPMCCGKMSNLATGPDGQVYALLDQTTLERVAADGTFSQLTIAMAGDTSFGGQVIRNALTSGPDGALWISMGLNHGCNPEVERVTPSGSYAILELPITCNNFNGPAPEINAFAAGPDGNLWYTRGTSVGKIVLQ